MSSLLFRKRKRKRTVVIKELQLLGYALKLQLLIRHAYATTGNEKNREFGKVGLTENPPPPWAALPASLTVFSMNSMLILLEGCSLNTDYNKNCLGFMEKLAFIYSFTFF